MAAPILPQAPEDDGEEDADSKGQQVASSIVRGPPPVRAPVLLQEKPKLAVQWLCILPRELQGLAVRRRYTQPLDQLLSAPAHIAHIFIVYNHYKHCSYYRSNVFVICEVLVTSGRLL
jgi:hypothetical protein